MRPRRWSIAFAALAGLACPGGGAGQAPRVTLEQFKQLRWLSGSWRGSGGAYPSFFEEYGVIDDSTIQMRALADSTFRVATDSSRIEWRNGVVSKRGGSSYVAVELTASSVRFAREGASGGGFTWTSNSADQWTATLHPSTPQGSETVYVMRRVRG